MSLPCWMRLSSRAISRNVPGFDRFLRGAHGVLTGLLCSGFWILGSGFWVLDPRSLLVYPSLHASTSFLSLYYFHLREDRR